jgi:hypothetical protein
VAIVHPVGELEFLVPSGTTVELGVTTTGVDREDRVQAYLE